MRQAKLSLLAFLALLWTGAAVPAFVLSAPDTAVAQQQPQQDAPAAAPAAPDIDVKIDGGGEKHVVWFANPMVLAAAGIGLIVVIAIIAMASRGGGTTIVER